MAFVALKPCKFGGVVYRQGSTIPADKVLRERVPALVSIGMIAEVKEEVGAKQEAAQPKPKPANKPEEAVEEKQPEPTEPAPKPTRARTKK